MLSRSAVETLEISSRAQAAADGVSSQRQRQAGDFLPPFAEVHNAVQAGLIVGELAFVDDQSGFVLARQHAGDDLIEGHDFGLDSGSEQFQRQIRGSKFAGDSDYFVLDFADRNARGAIIIGP